MTSDTHPTLSPGGVNPFVLHGPPPDHDPHLIQWGPWVISRQDYIYITARPNRQRCFICRGFNCHHPLCNELRAGWAIKMHFGKHRGTPIQDVPTTYLLWVRAKCMRPIPPENRQEIDKVLLGREVKAA